MVTRLASAAVVASLLTVSCAAAAASAQEKAREEAFGQAAALAPRHARWLEDVALLISPAEREAFLSLGKDYQRDAFIRRFWQARDPYPETARNELEETWEERLALARERWGKLDGDRARMLLLNGEPEATSQAHCLEVVRPLEMWFYSGTDRIRDSFALVFYSPSGSRRGPFRLWYPSQGLRILLDRPLAVGDSPQEVLAAIEADCVEAQKILAGLTSAIDWGRVEESVDVVPQAGDEWLQTFVAFSTDLPPDAATFDAGLEVSFPGRHQSRTVVQGVVAVPATEAAGDRSFVLDGEVLRKGELFEHFRYRFNLHSSEAAGGAVPLVFQRFLRPGGYTLVLKVEDVERHAFFRAEQSLEVPIVAAETGAVNAGAVADGAAIEAPAAPPGERPAGEARADLAQRLAEANFALDTGEVSVQLLRPPAGLLVGRARFEAMASGEAVAKVRFLLDGKPVLAKTRPPYSVELSLGDSPRVHTLRAVALDADGRELAADEVLLNAGPHRFAVRLVEPRAGRYYVESLRAHAEVEVPEGETLERVELYLDETLVATLYQPPFSQPILLPRSGATHYVRAVAYLTDGNSTEDAAFVNAPDYTDALKVRFVELYTTVVDRKSRPVEGLEAADFTVLEDGVEQEVRRFELVRDQSIYAGILLDTSSSMVEELDDAVEGALAFFHTVLEPKDRAAVITFAEAPHLAVRFTNDQEVLAGGLAGLTAAGETALYDSLVYALYYFSGIRGKRALVLLSDGEDVNSRYSYEDVSEYARRTGVAIYTVGLKLGTRQADIRLKLNLLASETGGLAFFIDRASELDRVYETIEAELRSQYLLAYQSTSEGGDDRFREVEVRVARPGLTAKTLRGYYP